MSDTICTDEQPCGKDDCEYCDPFAAPPKPAMATVPESVMYGPIHAPVSDQSDKWNVPPKPASPIPSLSTCYISMRHTYKEYEEKVSDLAIAEHHVVQDKIDLEAAKTAVLLKYTDPKELGSNEAQRAAAIAFHVSHQSAKLQAATASVELLKCETEVARIRCRFADQSLRFCEALLMQQDSDRE